MAGLNNERLIIAAQALGIAERAFDDALGYVKERKQFGRTIGSFQTVRTGSPISPPRSSATRLLVYEVAERGRRQPRARCSRARRRWPS